MLNKISLMDAMELWESSWIYVMSSIDCNSSCFTLEANYMVSQKRDLKIMNICKSKVRSPFTTLV